MRDGRIISDGPPGTAVAILSEAGQRKDTPA